MSLPTTIRLVMRSKRLAKRIREKSASRPKPPPSPTLVQTLRAYWNIVTGNWLNVLLVTAPLAVLSYFLGWPKYLTFLFSLLCICPLSWILGQATEELAMHTNQTLGGLLNATFGNAVELIVSILALKSDLLDVVQASLLGSILGNLLLVLGCAFLLGGIRYKVQVFNDVAARTNSSLLLMVVFGVCVPAAFRITSDDETKLLEISRFTAIVLFAIYVLFLIFQLKTHAHLYEEENGESDEEEEPETPSLSVVGALVLLSITTVIVSVEAELLVDSIEATAVDLNLPQRFIGLIILPIVGNVAEHVTAITVARKNKMELALGVAVGSSTQIALSVIPLLVLVAWMMGKPLDLYFKMFETVVLVLAVLVVNSVSGNGQSNWLEGAMLLGAYLIVAVAFFFHP